jgi:hypothetical protein
MNDNVGNSEQLQIDMWQFGINSGQRVYLDGKTPTISRPPYQIKAQCQTAYDR